MMLCSASVCLSIIVAVNYKHKTDLTLVQIISGINNHAGKKVSHSASVHSGAWHYKCLMVQCLGIFKTTTRNAQNERITKSSTIIKGTFKIFKSERKLCIKRINDNTIHAISCIYLISLKFCTSIITTLIPCILNYNNPVCLRGPYLQFFFHDSINNLKKENVSRTHQEFLNLAHPGSNL